MKAAHVSLAALGVVLLSARGIAQSPTLEGAAAFAAGDYQRAAEILGPLAENWPYDADDNAAFIMALMYENGLGMSPDPVRACAMYLRAAEARGPSGRDPIVFTANELAIALRQSMTREQSGECHFFATVGWNHGFRPVTFNLEPGHWIRFELSANSQGIASTISFAGKEQRIDSVMPIGPGIRFAAIDHIELVVGGPAPTRRHFVEFFTWMVIHDKTWSLMWSVSEIVGHRLAGVTFEEILTAEQPSTTLPAEIRGLVQLRVNNSGDAEWAIGGSKPRSDVIETDAERQQLEQERRARKEAEEKVDWALGRDPLRPPLLRYSGADGCGRLSMYGWSEDRTEAIAIEINHEALQQSSAPQVFDFDIPARQADVKIHAHVFGAPQRHWPFCTDVVMDFPHEIWTAMTGTISVELSPPRIRRRQPQAYEATVRLMNAVFVSSSGIRVTQRQPIVLNAVITILGVYGL